MFGQDRQGRTDAVSRTQWVASTAAAIGMTVGLGILLFAAAGPRFASVPPMAATRDVVERLVYVALPQTQASTPAPAPNSPPLRKTVPRTASTRAAIAGTVRDSVPGSRAPAVIAPSEPRATAGTTTTAGRASAPAAVAGAPVGGVVAGFTSRPPGTIRFDSALRVFHDSLVLELAAGPPEPTQAERDARLRADALTAMAARGAGVPSAPAIRLGVGLAVPLPFGGPSRKQRERDRAVNAETMEILGRVHRRADSVVAARRRRADSIAHVMDSVRRAIRP